MENLPTFITQEDLKLFLWIMVFILPGSIIISFFFVHNKLLKKRNDEIKESKQMLTKLKEKTKTNGVGDHYKKKL